MAERNEANPTNESAKIAANKLDLPSVESPSISPADLVSEPAAVAAPIIASIVEPASVPAAEAPVAPVVEAAVTVTSAAWPSVTLFSLKPRQKRQALLAASVAIAGAVGAVTGAVLSSGFALSTPQTTIAAAEERKAMEQTIAQLTKDVTTLRTGLEIANKSAHAQIAKIAERADRIERTVSAELVTGSISAPQTVPAVPVPVPTPRPAPRIAAPEVAPPARPQIVQDWAIREARDGYVYVQGHGDVFQVVPGAPLPGLGPVESIRRQDGRWVVTTPKGIIVSMRDRRYFE